MRMRMRRREREWVLRGMKIRWTILRFFVDKGAEVGREWGRENDSWEEYWGGMLNVSDFV